MALLSQIEAYADVEVEREGVVAVVVRKIAARMDVPGYAGLSIKTEVLVELVFEAR